MSNCPRCQIVLLAWSVSNCPRCQIVPSPPAVFVSPVVVWLLPSLGGIRIRPLPRLAIWPNPVSLSFSLKSSHPQFYFLSEQEVVGLWVEHWGDMATLNPVQKELIWTFYEFEIMMPANCFCIHPCLVVLAPFVALVLKVQNNFEHNFRYSFPPMSLSVHELIRFQL